MSRSNANPSIRTRAATRPGPPSAANAAAFASCHAQLDALYAERQQLITALGVADAHGLIEMVHNLEAQLFDLYATQADNTADAPAQMDPIQQLADSLDRFYTRKSVTLDLDTDSPTLKASWHERRATGTPR